MICGGSSGDCVSVHVEGMIADMVANGSQKVDTAASHSHHWRHSGTAVVIITLWFRNICHLF